MVKNFFQNNLALIIVSSIYLLSIFIVAPWGNYPVGDDFYHYIQIKLFQTGDFYRNGQIGPPPSSITSFFRITLD